MTRRGVGFKMQKRPKSTFYRRVTKAARLDLDSILLDDAGGEERQSEATRGDRQADQPPSDSSPERDRSLDECASSATPIPDIYIAPGRQEPQTVSHDGSDSSCDASRDEGASAPIEEQIRAWFIEKAVSHRALTGLLAFCAEMSRISRPANIFFLVVKPL